MLQQAYLAGGCFWCLEAVFTRVRGVSSVVSGYSGGKQATANYRQVCSGDTGHAEVIEISYDSEKISYDILLDIFFATHDPTSLNRQGNDVGTQYRSAIFYQNDSVKLFATDKIAELNQAQLFAQPIVTTVEKLEHFYPAEDYHQSYYQLNPQQGYCQAVISPKLAKFRSKFAHLLQA